MVRLRLSTTTDALDFDAVVAQRIAEADEFYSFQPADLPEDGKRVQRQAFAGLLYLIPGGDALTEWLPEQNISAFLNFGTPYVVSVQQVTAQQIGVDPVLTIAANTTGGVTGKMISPQSIAVACAATGLVGKESDLFRFTLKHSLFFATIIGVITYIQAYYLQWMIPAVAR